jgi:hypothetical protein
MAPLHYTSPVTNTTAISGATEVVVATISNITTRWAGQTVTLIGYALVTTPGSTTSVTVQFRKQTLTGTQVGDHTAQAITAAAATSNMYVVAAQDTPGDTEAFTYVLTVTCTAGSGAGSCVYGFIDAIVD